MINATRLFFPYGGWIDIGLTPDSDGYGNATVSVLAVITYNKGWLALTKCQVADFFIALRKATGREIDEMRVYYDHTNDYLSGTFNISNNGQSLNIIFTDEENDKTGIIHFMMDDVIALLGMERIIDGRISIINVTRKDVDEAIEILAFKCREYPSEVLELACSKYCDGITVELAVNHFQFFMNFVEEVRKNEVSE